MIHRLYRRRSLRDHCVFPGLLTLLAFLLPGAVRGGDAFVWGVNGHPLTQAAYIEIPLDEQLALAAELGVTWYRVDWPADAFYGDTARCDELAAKAAARRITLLPVLHLGAKDRQAAPEQIRERAAAYGRAVAERYRGKISHWELTNEPDLPALIKKGERMRDGRVWAWDGDPAGDRPEHFHQERYLKAKAEIAGLGEGLRAADPGSVRIVNGGTWTHTGLIERLAKEDRVAFEILSWHWYSNFGDITCVSGMNLVERLNELVDGRPLWLTEISHEAGSMNGKEGQYARHLKDAVPKLAALPGVSALFVYQLLDEPYFGAGNPESHFGLVEVSRAESGGWRIGRRKAAFHAWREAVAAARSRSLPSGIHSAPGS